MWPICSYFFQLFDNPSSRMGLLVVNKNHYNDILFVLTARNSILSFMWSERTNRLGKWFTLIINDNTIYIYHCNICDHQHNSSLQQQLEFELFCILIPVHENHVTLQRGYGMAIIWHLIDDSKSGMMGARPITYF